MTGVVEVRTRTGWKRLAPSAVAPRVLETETIEVRGLPPDQIVNVGFSRVTSDRAGAVMIRPAADDQLSGHVGLVEITVDGVKLGEVELVPGKLSEPAYRELRADLQRVWTDLVFDPNGVSSVHATIPTARELWRRVDASVRKVVDRPNEQLVVGTTTRRLDQVKRAQELQPAVVRAGVWGRSAMTRTLQRSTDTPENQMTAVTLQLLKSHARRDPSADDITRRIDSLLREPVFSHSRQPIRRVTWGMRSDPRYGRVLAVHQILNRPELAATEGPGELRLGVPALSRLFEYWVYLQVLVAAAERYGPPTGAGFEQLAVSLPGRRRRLELPRGTTVTFPGPVHVAFEPVINSRGDGWMGLEYVPHPDPTRQQMFATPDVVVFREGGTPWLTVFDAKYIGRSWVETEAVKLHEKYARIRLSGIPIVRNVVAVHPHVGFACQWAGYGHLAMAPGAPAPKLPLPLPIANEGNSSPSQHDPSAGAPDHGLSSGLSYSRDDGRAPEDSPVAVVADQYWMHQWLAGRRLDIAGLGATVAGGRAVRSVEIVMPRIAQLVPFATAVERRGWTVHWVESIERDAQIPALVALVTRRVIDGPVVVLTGDSELLRQLPDSAETFDDLSQVPLL